MTFIGRKTLENLISHIQKDEDDNNLSDHLSDLLQSLLTQPPDKALSMLEQISSFHKKHKSYRPTKGFDKIVPSPEHRHGVVETETLQRAKVHIPNKTKIVHFLEDSIMLNWAGISFGTGQNYEISLRLKELGLSLGNDLINLRLWGKMLGQKSDYWIAEGQVTGYNIDLGNDMEVRGKGANSYSYWALSTKPGSTWEALPNLRPRWVFLTKCVRKTLTGDLDAEINVGGFMPFLARERAYLRALIARISAATILAPNGAFAYTDEEGIQSNQEFEFPGSDDLKVQGTWAHAREHLLPNGRTAYQELDPELDEETAAKFEQEREADPPQEKLRAITSDEPVVEGNSDGWTVSQVGDLAQYSFESGPKSYAINIVRSNRWPGAYTVARGTRYCNIYVGYGLRDKWDPSFAEKLAEEETPPEEESDVGDDGDLGEAGESDRGSEDEAADGEK